MSAKTFLEIVVWLLLASAVGFLIGWLIHRLLHKRGAEAAAGATVGAAAAAAGAGAIGLARREDDEPLAASATPAAHVADVPTTRPLPDEPGCGTQRPAVS